MAFARTAISTTGNFTSGSTSVTNVANTTGMFINMLIYGPNIRPDTIITNIVGTTVTMSQTALSAGTGGAITGQYITQSGTDADPSGLSAMTGVTTITQASGDQRRTVFDLGTNQLVVTGTLTHDPDIFEIVTSLQNGINMNTGAVYNYGVKRTINGQDSYSRGLGLVFTYTGAIASNFGLYAGAGTFNWNGGMIKSAAPPLINATFTTNSFNCVWHNTNPGTDYQLRFGTAAPTFNAITLSGVQRAVLLFLNAGFNAATVKYEFGAYQTPGGGGSNRTLLNSVFTGNQSTADIRLNQLSGTQTQITAVKNPDRFPVVNRLNNGARGDIPVVEAVTFNVTNAAGAAAADVIGYIKDSNNGSRINSSGTPSNNYVNDRAYVATSNASGVLSLGDVLTLAINEDPASVSAINYDYRSNFGNNSADFNVYLGGYNYNAVSTRQTLLGNGGRTVAWTLFSDSNVTLTRANALAKLASSFTVNATTKVVTVTANSTYDDIYDALKAWKYNGTQTNVETPTVDTLVVTASGQNLTAATGWTLVVNDGVTLSSGVKFTFVQFPTVTINGAGRINGIYGTSAGVSTILELRDVSAGSAYIIANDSTKATILYGTNATGSAQTYTAYFPPGSAGTQVLVAREKYGYQRSAEVLTLAAGGMWYTFVDIPDVGISQTDQATVAAYTAIENADKFYDRTALFRLTEAGIKLGQIATRDGTSVRVAGYNMVINQSAASVYAISGATITLKATGYANGTKFTNTVLDNTKTLTANTNEVLSADFEDANGDSGLTILGGDGTFELWKVTTSTATADYQTGTKLTTPTIGNTRFRFIGVTGFDIVGVDINSNVRRRTSMAKGVYEQAFYVGDQIQLAQAPEVLEINNKVDLLAVDIEAVKGSGFATGKHSLVKLKQHVTNMNQA